MKVLTFNLHSQYLYLLSFTGWNIHNLVIPPTDPPGWHTQPYGYVTHSPAVHPVPGFDYHAYFPGEDWTNPTMVPAVPNIINVDRPDNEYDLILYIERDSLNFYRGTARKKIMVNFNADGFSPNGYVDLVVGHVPNTAPFYIPMGIPDDFLPRDPSVEAILVSYAAGRWRPHLLNQEMLKIVSDEMPLHFHDIVDETWSYEVLRKVLAGFWVYFSPVMMRGGPPLALIEALMAGLPCIVHDPYEHFWAFNEEECLKVSTPESALLAAKSLFKFEGMREEVGQAGRAKALKFFSIDAFVEGWKEAAR